MFAESQSEIVKAIANHVREPWDTVKLNVEIGDVCGSETVSELGHFYAGNKKEQIILNIRLRGLFRELRKAMANNDAENKLWSSCDLNISSDGEYSFDFSYEPPKRITGLANA